MADYFHGMEEVVGSIPTRSTKLFPLYLRGFPARQPIEKN